MISIALFGLIALAGFTLLDSELRVQARTEGRLEKMGDLQRAMYVMTSDFEQMSGDVTSDGAAVSFRRYADAGDVQVGYALKDGTLQRTLGAAGVQRLITDVTAVRVAFYVEGVGWRTDWSGADDAPRPSAVEIDVTLKGDAGEGGTLRRLVALPDKP